MENLISKYKNLINLISLKTLQRKYINIKKLITFNKKVFDLNDNQEEGLILVEYFQFFPSLIPFSFFSYLLSKKYKSKIVAFHPRPNPVYKKIVLFLNNLPISFFKIFKSFGTKKLITPLLDKNKYKNKTLEVISSIKSKKDLLNLKIENILVGDLFYDEYLASKSKSTINLKNKDFEEFLLEAVSLFYYWYDFYLKNSVNSVIISHSVYFVGLCGRIAAFKDIPVYQISVKHAYYLNKQNFIKNSNFISQKNEFDKLNPEIKKKLKEISKNQLDKRFCGFKDIKLSNDQDTESKIYGKVNLKKKILKNSGNKTKILIAAPCFQDAQHAFGSNNLFVDSYEWINFLGKKSEKLTNFDWYLKLHPAIYSRNIKYAEYFTKKYPRINFLPKETTHNQLVYEGISVVLTSYGSVGHEYPIFNIPVVNSSIDGPHKDYGFNIYPKDISEYSQFIDQLDKFKVDDVDLVKDKIYEHYAMRYIMHYSPLKNIIGVTQKFVHNFDTIEIVKYWLSTIDEKQIELIKKDYLNFINSKKFKMVDYKNLTENISTQEPMGIA